MLAVFSPNGRTSFSLRRNYVDVAFAFVFFTVLCDVYVPFSCDTGPRIPEVREFFVEFSRDTVVLVFRLLLVCFCFRTKDLFLFFASQWATGSRLALSMVYPFFVKLQPWFLFWPHSTFFLGVYERIFDGLSSGTTFMVYISLAGLIRFLRFSR